MTFTFIFLVGLFMAAICQRLKLPRIIGMLITGIVLGPYVLDLLDPSILSISADLRQMALIIILLKAGLSLVDLPSSNSMKCCSPPASCKKSMMEVLNLKRAAKIVLIGVCFGLILLLLKISFGIDDA